MSHHPLSTATPTAPWSPWPLPLLVILVTYLVVPTLVMILATALLSRVIGVGSLLLAIPIYLAALLGGAFSFQGLNAVRSKTLAARLAPFADALESGEVERLPNFAAPCVNVSGELGGRRVTVAVQEGHDFPFVAGEGLGIELPLADEGPDGDRGEVVFELPPPPLPAEAPRQTAELRAALVHLAELGFQRVKVDLGVKVRGFRRGSPWVFPLLSKDDLGSASLRSAVEAVGAVADLLRRSRAKKGLVWGAAEAPRCPGCGDSLAVSDAVPCSTCSMLHHAACRSDRPCQAWGCGPARLGAPAAEWSAPASSAAAELRCPYCHDDLRAEEPARACTACATSYHATCAEEAGACLTLGCANRRPGAHRA